MAWRGDLQEFWFYLRRQLLARIPSVSGLAALAAAAWVASTFEVSPWRAFLARGRLLRGSRHYVDESTYRMLAIAIPLLAAAVTAFLVQRGLRRRRAFWLAQDRQIVARYPDRLTEARRRETVLDEALQFGLISRAEHESKLATLYACYARDGGSALARAVSTKLT